MISSRKPHRKVRTGCRCDENKPSCNNCIRHSVPCDIMTASAAGTPISPAASGVGSPLVPTSSTSPGNPLNTLSPMNGSPLPSHQSPLPSLNSIQPRSLYLVDMELMHHYATSTSYTLSSGAAASVVWRLNVPQIAYSHEFVMRGILAMAALHIAHFKPEKRVFYVEQAMIHYQLALPVATALLSNITEDNCTALYVFSSMALLHALASPRKDSDFLIVDDTDVSSWVYLLRGLRSISDVSYEIIQNGPLAPMFSAGARRAQLRENPGPYEDFYNLNQLQQYVKASSGDPEDTESYMQAIDELRKSLSVLFTVGPAEYEVTDLFIWPYKVPGRYLSLLRRREQLALIVYAYFCIPMKRLDSHWWIQGWAIHLIRQIYALLNPENRLWIQGVIEEVGWVP
ncbi:C6 zinc finger protein [Rutstroemia sp. NJR-2017a BBW]|nr:C6 zinc finger protein [Rutstroemia sp. NJR-2017a BBW]